MKTNIKESKNRRTYPSIYGISEATKILGVPLTLHLYFSHQKEFDEINRIDSEVITMEHELAEYKGKNFKKYINEKNKFRKYEKYFNIKIGNDGILTHEINYNKIDELKVCCGYFSIVSSQLDLNASEVLILYRKKDGEKKYLTILKII